MKTAEECPTAQELNQLLQSELSEVESGVISRHLENCSACRLHLDRLASGEIPICTYAADLNVLNPSDQSNYWKAVASVEKEIGDFRSKSSHEMNPKLAASLKGTAASDVHEGASNQNPVAASDSQQSSAPKKSAPDEELGFLEPSDDPAYLGRLHHFQIARVIGRGGMGIVLEAFDTHLHRTVALKVLNPQFQANDNAKQRFCREGRAAAAISHEHVVPMYHVAKAQHGEVAYLVMQLIEGTTLENLMKPGVPLEASEVARIGMQIAAGLSAAHKKDTVHRDIKPSNIMIEAETNRVKLTDFGLARVSDDVKLTKTGMITGTPLYMSPEQTMGGEADERSDLFSLGAVLYEMATGIAPFQAPSALGVMQKIMNHVPSPPHLVNAAISRPLSDLIMALLTKKPNDRPESAADVATALAAIVNEYGPISPLQIPAVAASEVKKISGSHRRLQNRWANAAWVAAIAGIAIAIVSYLMLRPDRGDSFPSFVLEGNPGTVWSVDFAPGGKQLASAIEDGSVRIWDLDTQSLKKSFNAHRGIVWMVAYHPTRPYVMTSGDDAYVRLWNASTFEAVKEWKTNSAVRGASFSPNGERIVAGDREGTIHIFDIESGAELASKTQPGTIMGIDYSADGKQIATVGSDKTVRIFDADTLVERQSLMGHEGPIYSVKFAPKGNS